MSTSDEKFDHGLLEQEIGILSEEVKKRTGLEKKDPSKIKEAIRDSLNNLSSSEDDKLNSRKFSVLPDYLDQSSPEIKLKIERLVDRVFHQGLKKTLIEAKKEGPFFLDALHDVLSEKLYDEMKKRKLI